MLAKIIAVFSILVTSSMLFIGAMLGAFVTDTAYTQLDKTLPPVGTTASQLDDTTSTIEDGKTVEKIAKTGSLKGVSFALPVMVVIGAGFAIWRAVS